MHCCCRCGRARSRLRMRCSLHSINILLSLRDAPEPRESKPKVFTGGMRNGERVRIRAEQMIVAWGTKCFARACVICVFCIVYFVCTVYTIVYTFTHHVGGSFKTKLSQERMTQACNSQVCLIIKALHFRRPELVMLSSIVFPEISRHTLTAREHIKCQQQHSLVRPSTAQTISINKPEHMGNPVGGTYEMLARCRVEHMCREPVKYSTANVVANC